MKINIYIIALFSLFSQITLFSNICMAQQQKNTAKQSLKYTLPDIPESILEPSERAEYLVSHYWDNFDIANPAWLADSDSIELAFVDYIVLFPYVDSNIIKQSISKMMNRTTKEIDIFYWFADVFDKYLYNFSSPMRNEPDYTLFLQYLINNPKLDKTQKVRPKYQLEQINKNPIGAMAANFEYSTLNGKKNNLYDIKANYTIILFTNPKCIDCKKIKDKIIISDKISSMINNGELKIIAVYPDEDIDSWKSYTENTSSIFIEAYDATTNKNLKNKLYSIRAIPSIYLLDKDKKILLKDASFSMLEEILDSL